jgi:hypothetical protein
VGGGDAAPNRAEMRALDGVLGVGLLGLVQVDDALAKVEVDVLAVVHTLDLDQGVVVVLVAEAAGGVRVGRVGTDRRKPRNAPCAYRRGVLNCQGGVGGGGGLEGGGGVSEGT